MMASWSVCVDFAKTINISFKSLPSSLMQVRSVRLIVHELYKVEQTQNIKVGVITLGM